MKVKELITRLLDEPMDAEVCLQDPTEHMSNGTICKGYIFDITYIEHQPTIDAVSVVRCKECKYWRNTDAEKIPTASIACGNMHADDFCSYGEREGE